VLSDRFFFWRGKFGLLLGALFAKEKVAGAEKRNLVLWMRKGRLQKLGKKENQAQGDIEK